MASGSARRDGGLALHNHARLVTGDCIDALRGKPEASHKLYEIHTGNGAIMSAAEVLALGPPAVEEEDGSGDIVSVEREPSTDDDQPFGVRRARRTGIDNPLGRAETGNERTTEGVTSP